MITITGIPFPVSDFAFFIPVMIIRDVISIHFDYFPTKRFKLCLEIPQVKYFTCRAIDLFSIVIHNCDEIIHFVGCSEHQCLPVLSFLEFTITGKAINKSVVLI